MQKGGMEFAESKSQGKCAAVKNFCSLQKQILVFVRLASTHRAVVEKRKSQRKRKREKGEQEEARGTAK